MSAILYLTTGQPGCGKTYSRVRWLISDFLPNSSGLYITNFPLNVDLIAESVSAKTGKPVEDYISRIHVISDEEMQSWRSLNDRTRKQELLEMKNTGEFPPVMYLESLNLNNARVAIDEFHRYFNKKSPSDVLLMWNDWFAEIRKSGCTFEAITQDLDQLPPEFIGKVGIRTDLVPYGTVRDPFFKVPLSDWYELRAAYFGVREQKVCQTEYRKGTSFSGRAKWIVNNVDKFSITSDLFQYYNSYQRTESGGDKASIVLPADRYKKFTVMWFLRRHFFKLFSRFFLVVFFFWLTFGGGVSWAIDRFVSTLGNVSSANMRVKKNDLKVDETKEIRSIVSASKSVSVFDPVASDGAGESILVPDLTEYKPAMFLDGGCYLRSGLFVSLNFEFKGGYYAGKRVVSVNFPNRSYQLDNGDVITMY